MGLDAALTIACRLCNQPANPCGRQRELRHEAHIYQCGHCDLLQTEAPHWIAEAYSQAISALDTGAIQRNQITVGIALATAQIVGLDKTARCLDWGGGHGVFVRMMRDRGFDFRWRDEYAENLFARGFEGKLEEPYELITSFEVFEHFVDVRQQLERLFALRPAFLLVGTLLHEGYRDDWWYFTNDTGQHVAFYSRKTMQFIAAEFGYQVFAGPGYTVFVRDPSLGAARRKLLRLLVDHAELAYGLTSLVPEALRMLSKVSRTQSDHHALASARAELHAMNPSESDPDSAATKPHVAT
jgi:hypothetical protein